MSKAMRTGLPSRVVAALRGRHPECQCATGNIHWGCKAGLDVDIEIQVATAGLWTERVWTGVLPPDIDAWRAEQMRPGFAAGGGLSNVRGPVGATVYDLREIGRRFIGPAVFADILGQELDLMKVPRREAESRAGWDAAKAARARVEAWCLDAQA